MSGPGGSQVEVTDYEYLEHFGDPLPDEPEIPEQGIKAWTIFWRLHKRRTPAFSGVSPLTYSEIRHFSELTRTYIGPDEVELIVAIDDAFLSAVKEGQDLRKSREEARSKRK